MHLMAVEKLLPCFHLIAIQIWQENLDVELQHTRTEQVAIELLVQDINPQVGRSGKNDQSSFF